MEGKLYRRVCMVFGCPIRKSRILNCLKPAYTLTFKCTLRKPTWSKFREPFGVPNDYIVVFGMFKPNYYYLSLVQFRFIALAFL